LGSGFGGRLNFGDFALAAQETRVSGMAGRYAQALSALCQETGAAEKVAADLAAFVELVRSSTDLQRFVKSPVVSAEEQVKALDALLSGAGIDGIAAKFIKLVAAKRRLFAIFDMIRDFNSLNDARKGVTRAEVTAAEVLKPKHVEALRAALADVSGRGEVEIAVKVDPAIIGGLIVKLGSRMVDSSLKTKLNSIRSRMKEAG
jgi:F-type H+-transporting ATPase subunit delta